MGTLPGRGAADGGAGGTGTAASEWAPPAGGGGGCCCCPGAAAPAPAAGLGLRGMPVKVKCTALHLRWRAAQTGRRCSLAGPLCMPTCMHMDAAAADRAIVS
jgi:hypothetical protein